MQSVLLFVANGLQIWFDSNTNGGILFGFRSKNLLNLDSKTEPCVGFRVVDESFKPYSIKSFLRRM